MTSLANIMQVNLKILLHHLGKGGNTSTNFKMYEFHKHSQ